MIKLSSIVWQKKGSQERLASRISGLSDITLNDDDAYRISCVRSASRELKVWRTIPVNIPLQGRNSTCRIVREFDTLVPHAGT